jgi:hypothetical protein
MAASGLGGTVKATVGVALAAAAMVLMPVPGAHADRVANPTATFAGLDKITGRIISFDVAINETVQFGALQVTPRVCYSRTQTEAPQTTGFVEVDEITLENSIRRIFTGWMFAASPGLHAVEHAVYDIWLTDCKGAVVAPPPAPAPSAEAAPSTAAPATPRRSGASATGTTPARP